MIRITKAISLSGEEIAEEFWEKSCEEQANFFNKNKLKNNDGNNAINKATYSTELCEKLLNIYAQPNSIIYDSFNGTGTTGVAALKLGHSYIGSEISKEQCEFSEDRLNKVLGEIECTA